MAKHHNIYGHAPNYMVFMTDLTRYEKDMCKSNPSDTQRTQFAHARQQAIRCYKAKDYVLAGQWHNAARRASLNMC